MAWSILAKGALATVAGGGLFGSLVIKDEYIKQKAKEEAQFYVPQDDFVGSTASTQQRNNERKTQGMQTFATPSKGQVFAYPLDIDPEQDHLEIDEYLYRRPGSQNVPPGEWGISYAYQRASASGPQASVAAPNAYEGSIVLPMPKVVDAIGTQWGKSTMSGDELAKVNRAGAYIGMGQAGSNRRQDREIDAAGLRGRESGLGVPRVSRRGTDYINERVIVNRARAAQKGIDSANVDANDITARTMGKIMNPNAELLFQGPVLREFGFKWLMVARSSREGDMIRKIIRKFKAGSAPVYSNTAMLETPSIWGLRYMRGKNVLRTANQFGQMALTQMSVDYAPQGYWNAYGDSQPIAIRLAVTFKELKPIYKEDQTNSDPASVGY